MKRNGLTDSCIDQEISKDISSIASFFKNVNCLLDKFGLPPSNQTDIEIKSRHSTAEATKEALQLWWQQNPYHATFRTLLNILLEQRIGDVAASICSYLAEKKGKSYNIHLLVMMLFVLLQSPQHKEN